MDNHQSPDKLYLMAVKLLRLQMKLVMVWVIIKNQNTCIIEIDQNNSNSHFFSACSLASNSNQTVAIIFTVQVWTNRNLYKTWPVGPLPI